MIKYCVLDIETWTPTGKPDPEKDILRYVGFKDGETGKRVMMHYTDPKIQRVLDYYEYYVGHNIINYDKRVMVRHGFKFFYKNVFVDTYQITDKRAKSMLYIDLNQGDRSLSSLCERFNLPHKKGTYDYLKLQTAQLFGEDEQELEEYLFGDLDATDDLFKMYYDLFFGLREYMSPENRRGLKWLTTSPGACAYKCICHSAKLPEEYDDVEGAQKNYAGGFVSEPYVDFVDGHDYS